MGMSMEVRAENFAKLAGPEFGAENVLAEYVRRRGMSIKAVSREWDLTDAEARGVIYARAGRATVKKILKHKRGGWPIGLMLLTGVIGHDLETHIEKERARERASWQDTDRHLGNLGRNLRALTTGDSDTHL